MPGNYLYLSLDKIITIVLTNKCNEKEVKRAKYINFMPIINCIYFWEKVNLLTQHILRILCQVYFFQNQKKTKQ